MNIISAIVNNLFIILPITLFSGFAAIVYILHFRLIPYICNREEILKSPTQKRKKFSIRYWKKNKGPAADFPDLYTTQESSWPRSLRPAFWTSPIIALAVLTLFLVLWIHTPGFLYGILKRTPEDLYFKSVLSWLLITDNKQTTNNIHMYNDLLWLNTLVWFLLLILSIQSEKIREKLLFQWTFYRVWPSQDKNGNNYKPSRRSLKEHIKNLLREINSNWDRENLYLPNGNPWDEDTVRVMRHLLQFTDSTSELNKRLENESVKAVQSIENFHEQVEQFLYRVSPPDLPNKEEIEDLYLGFKNFVTEYKNSCLLDNNKVTFPILNASMDLFFEFATKCKEGQIDKISRTLKKEEPPTKDTFIQGYLLPHIKQLESIENEERNPDLAYFITQYLKKLLEPLDLELIIPTGNDKFCPNIHETEDNSIEDGVIDKIVFRGLKYKEGALIKKACVVLYG